MPMRQDAPVATESPAPQCRMCARPARWLINDRLYSMYCAGRSCGNRNRICQECGDPFVIGVDGAGTKYCSAACKTVAYHPISTTRQRTLCAWCGTRQVKGRTRRDEIWPYVCDACTQPIRHLLHRLRTHHVDLERVRQLLEYPWCEVCGRDIVTPVMDSITGKYRSYLVVDHDHRCCASTNSCGACVRGLLCSSCNTAAGMLQDSPRNALRLGKYLAHHTPEEASQH